ESAAETYCLLVHVYGDHSPSEPTCRYRSQRFRNGDFDVNDNKRDGAPKKFQNEELKELLDIYPSPCGHLKNYLQHWVLMDPPLKKPPTCSGNCSEGRKLGTTRVKGSLLATKNYHQVLADEKRNAPETTKNAMAPQRSSKTRNLKNCLILIHVRHLENCRSISCSWIRHWKTPTCVGNSSEGRKLGTTRVQGKTH
ncbi:putative histone methyltransferase activity H3-K27 specific protein, partial [Trypoxylus dichotomus]